MGGGAGDATSGGRVRPRLAVLAVLGAALAPSLGPLPGAAAQVADARGAQPGPRWFALPEVEPRGTPVPMPRAEPLRPGPVPIPHAGLRPRGGVVMAPPFAAPNVPSVVLPGAQPAKPSP